MITHFSIAAVTISVYDSDKIHLKKLTINCVVTTPLYDFSEVKFTADHFFYLRLFYGNEYFGSEQRILFDVGPKQNETKKK